MSNEMIEGVEAALIGANHRSFRNRAKAAIEAMKEPTQEMMTVGREWQTYDGLKAVYRAMIETALKNG